MHYPEIVVVVPNSLSSERNLGNISNSLLNHCLNLKSVLKILGQVLIFILLTAITQIGGVVYVLSLVLNRLWTTDFKFKSGVSFLGLYLIATFLIIPITAPMFGRQKIKHTAGIKPTNYLTVLLNRNYVKSNLNDLLLKTDKELEGTAVQIRYLDANFPFLSKFPLLPHLSHNDGEKLDISLIYEDQSGLISNRKKSISGYGAFEGPKSGEPNQIDICRSRGYFQYDFPKYLTFGIINQDLKFSEKGTIRLIKALLKNDNLGKIFIEPHLKQRLGLTNSRVRYHGCQAVRHDDHIHIQL